MLKYDFYVFIQLIEVAWTKKSLIEKILLEIPSGDESFDVVEVREELADLFSY